MPGEVLPSPALDSTRSGAARRGRNRQSVTGDALIEFTGAGGITSISSAASLSLNGSKSLVALSTARTTKSALTGLATVVGSFTLDGSAR